MDTKQDYEEDLNFSLKYQDENGKEWLFCRLKKKRAFVREDGKNFSHTAIYNNYEYIGKINKETK